MCTANPPLRCGHAETSELSSVCGQLARWARPADRPEQAKFFCDAHRKPGDKEIGENETFRRVTLSCDIIFAGVSMSPWRSNTEALNRLEDAVRAQGGLINFHGAVCETRYSSPPPPPERPAAGKGRR